MSHFHSESRNPNNGLTVRVKLLSLNQTSAPVEKESRKAASEHKLGALIARSGKQLKPKDAAPGMQLETSAQPETPKPGELCMVNLERIPSDTFEEHIDECTTCASRVALQLDFMECLEVAVYQRLSEPDSEKVRGALMVSVPELNFAICGELEVD